MVRDDNAQAAYLWNPTSKTLSSFEAPGIISLKSTWSREKGLRGMMFWDLSDDAAGDTTVDLAFNAQRIFLPGAVASQLNSPNFLI